MRIVWIRGYYKKNYSVLRISGFASCCPCCFGVGDELFAFGCAFTLRCRGGSVFFGTKVLYSLGW